MCAECRCRCDVSSRSLLIVSWSLVCSPFTTEDTVKHEQPHLPRDCHRKTSSGSACEFTTRGRRGRGLSSWTSTSEAPKGRSPPEPPNVVGLTPHRELTAHPNTGPNRTPTRTNQRKSQSKVTHRSRSAMPHAAHKGGQPLASNATLRSTTVTHRPPPPLPAAPRGDVVHVAQDACQLIGLEAAVHVGVGAVEDAAARVAVGGRPPATRAISGLGPEAIGGRAVGRSGGRAACCRAAGESMRRGRGRPTYEARRRLSLFVRWPSASPDIASESRTKLE